ncbi:MAG: hypothetical protein AAF125_19120 [Chloroflexota bacterium]
MGTERLWSAYKTAMVGRIGQPIMVAGADGDLHGVALDVEHDGALVIRTDEGDLQRVYAGDVTVKSFGG